MCIRDRDIHVNLIKATTDQNSSTKDMAKTFMKYHQAKEATPVNQATLQRCGKDMQMALDKLTDANRTFDIYSNLAPLAMADDVLPLISAIQNALALSPSQEVNVDQPDTITAFDRRWGTAYTELLEKLQETGRKDLWGMPEPEAKAESTTKG